MKSSRFVPLLAVVILILIWSTVSPALAINYWDKLQEKQNELARVEQRLKELRQELARTRQREQSVLGELEYIQQQLDAAEAELKQIVGRMEATQSEIEEAKAQLETATRDYENKKETATVRVRQIHENGIVGYLEVLLSATDFRDLLVRFDLLTEVIAHDMDVLAELKEEKAQIEQDKAALEEKLALLEGMKEEAEHQQASIQSKANARERLLAQIQTNREKLKAAVDEEERVSKELESIISEYQAKAREQALGTGVFTWPSPGYTWITSPFGWRTHPILGTRRFHTGIDIGVPMRSTIVAADTGRVIIAGKVSGYGYTVVIDHGNYITTLYAHLDQILVSVGQKVLKGEVIARSGSSGLSTGPHLHFETRYNGSPVSPWQYFPD